MRLFFWVAAFWLVAATAEAAVNPNAVADAIARFDAGDYESVAATLRPFVEGKEIRDPVDRAQALRVYGIACVLTNRPLAAEAAFLRWLELDAGARLDAALVRPEVITFFESVKVHHREELLREVERRRPRSAVLSFLPPAGQYQNGHRLKFALLLAAEAALLATDLGTGIPLYLQQHRDGTFDNPASARALRIANWASFGTLLGVIVYGIIDGLVYFVRIRREIQRDENSLRASLRPRLEGIKVLF
jgi:hypothetical protein